jgi:hypothetical protein
MRKLEIDTLAVICEENPEETCICKPCWEKGTFDLRRVVALITSDDIEDWEKSKEENEYRCSECDSLIRDLNSKNQTD